MIKKILTSTLDKEKDVIFKRYHVAFYLMRSRMRERVCRCTLGWSRIVGACAVNRAGTRRSRGTKWRQSIAGRPVGRCLRSSVGPRHGGLNGRRNAVKPFCHSRRSRVRRGEGILQWRVTRAPCPLGISVFTSISSKYFQLCTITFHIMITMITIRNTCVIVS